MKAVRFAVVALTIAGAGLAGCNKQPSEPAATPTAAAPDAPAGLAVTNGRLVLPAVSGNPAAVYFDIANTGVADTAIAGVSVEGAKSAMLHTTTQSGGMSSMKEMSSVSVRKGQTVQFAPGGNHVMAMGLDASLKAGGTTEVTLTFASGDKASFPAAIEPAGTMR
jgi:copper(I)-binding protein